MHLPHDTGQTPFTLHTHVVAFKITAFPILAELIGHAGHMLVGWVVLEVKIIIPIGVCQGKLFDTTS